MEKWIVELRDEVLPTAFMKPGVSMSMFFSVILNSFDGNNSDGTSNSFH